MNRRGALKGIIIGGVALALPPSWSIAAIKTEGAAVRLAALERQHGGRLGVSVLDTGSGMQVAHRGDEHFLMCSTFKLLLASAVLAGVDRGEESLDRRIVFGKEALLEYAPVAKDHVGPPGLTIGQLCKAAITLSDNTAANLLLKSIGGPAAVTEYARGLGDSFTLLDRMEPALNPVDATTPNAMLGDMRKVLLGGALSVTSREQLTAWLEGCQTGLQSLREGCPAAGVSATKPGSGMGMELVRITILPLLGRRIASPY